MHCPFCRNPDSRVVDSRTSDDGATIRRRRQCPNCSRRFSTSETASLSVLKRSGVSEPFSRAKVISGVRKACQGRPVSDDQLAMLAQRVDESIRSSGLAEIDAPQLRLTLLQPHQERARGGYLHLPHVYQPLQELDLVAYIRFASVYQSIDSLEDFETAIARLRAEAPRGGGPVEEPA